ncbi:MAG: phosphatidylglycerophosphatase A [Blastocatellia bacterium]|nr:phosphatidylglycerophosphatase A [Blastocatellia bacterium]MBK6428786.1 phosphatidylglycerophosphatase A [Blastocatellia bacterium]
MTVEDALPAPNALDRFARFVSSGGGAGFLPIAPGTWGSGIITGGLWLLNLVVPGLVMRPVAGPIMLGAALVLAWLGIWAGDRVAARLGDDDPSEVVIDEVVGQLLTYSLLPLAGRAWTGWSIEIALVVGFLLFRGLDIVKPGPIDDLQKLHGGLGIMADDFLAGIVGACVMLAAAMLL